MAWVGDVITVGDKELIYFGGYAEGHKVGQRRLGVATLRKDGFVSYDTTSAEGILCTRPFTWAAKQLTVNATVRGELRARLLFAESGLPIPGFFWRDCEPIHDDSVAHPVRWKGDVGVPTGKSVRLEFSLRDAELYGFEMIR